MPAGLDPGGSPTRRLLPPASRVVPARWRRDRLYLPEARPAVWPGAGPPPAQHGRPV